jgi:hypothetical protein
MRQAMAPAKCTLAHDSMQQRYHAVGWCETVSMVATARPARRISSVVFGCRSMEASIR